MSIAQATPVPNRRAGRPLVAVRIDPDAFYPSQSAAEALGVSEHTMRRSRWSGDGIPYSKLGQRVFYRGSDIIAALDKSRRRSTSDASGRERRTPADVMTLMRGGEAVAEFRAEVDAEAGRICTSGSTIVALEIAVGDLIVAEGRRAFRVLEVRPSDRPAIAAIAVEEARHDCGGSVGA